MKRYGLLLILLLGGCSKHGILSVTHDTTSYTGQAIVVAGQSNSVGIVQQAAPELLNALQSRFPGVSYVIGCGVNGTFIVNWYKGSTNEVNCIQAVQRSGLKVAGLVWWQGEAEVEAMDVAAINSWPMHFSDTVNAFRTDLNNPSLPVLYGRLGDAPAELASFWGMMKQAQANVNIPGVEMISLDGINHDVAPNQLHYTSDGYKACAKRF